MDRVIIIGAGPSGLFAAGVLSQSGIPCVVIDSGHEMEDRECPESAICRCATCDILEGIGGAGGFSDGKNTYSLTRGTQMETIFDESNQKFLDLIDEITLMYGSEGVLYKPLDSPPSAFSEAGFQFESYPLRHIGSDGIRRFIESYAGHLRNSGVEILSLTDAKRLTQRGTDGKYSVLVQDLASSRLSTMRSDKVIIATGLHGSPWMEDQAHLLGIPLSSGPAGFGIRFEARHETLASLFKSFYDFKLSKVYNDITFRSFCCNQRGWVLNENHRLMGIRNVNGHSNIDEPHSNASNFAIIAKITKAIHPQPQDLVKSIAMQINMAVDGGTVVQRARDFVAMRPTISDYFKVGESIRTNHQARAAVDIGVFMPSQLRDGFREFISDLDRIVPGILHSTSMVYAPEVKYYGMKFPVDYGTWECDGYPGLYVTGNASGYLDSFVSAALTGIIAANHITEGGE